MLYSVFLENFSSRPGRRGTFFWSPCICVRKFKRNIHVRFTSAVQYMIVLHFLTKNEHICIVLPEIFSLFWDNSQKTSYLTGFRGFSVKQDFSRKIQLCQFVPTMSFINFMLSFGKMILCCPMTGFQEKLRTDGRMNKRTALFAHPWLPNICLA